MLPVKIQLWGLFPTFYNMCRGGPSPWAAFAGQEFLDRIQEEQVSAYPKEIMDNMRKAAAMAELIAMEFGPKVHIVIVAADSFTGLALSLKHRLKGDLNLIVDGNIVPISRDLGKLRGEYEGVREHVAKAVEAIESLA
ncbi:MAG: hypothetical protein ACE5HJ_07540 [Thermoplasmata archaeon]